MIKIEDTTTTRVELECAGCGKKVSGTVKMSSHVVTGKLSYGRMPGQFKGWYMLDYTLWRIVDPDEATRFAVCSLKCIPDGISKIVKYDIERLKKKYGFK